MYLRTYTSCLMCPHSSIKKSYFSRWQIHCSFAHVSSSVQAVKEINFVLSQPTADFIFSSSLTFYGKGRLFSILLLIQRISLRICGSTAITLFCVSIWLRLCFLLSVYERASVMVLQQNKEFVYVVAPIFFQLIHRFLWAKKK